MMFSPRMLGGISMRLYCFSPSSTFICRIAAPSQTHFSGIAEIWRSGLPLGSLIFWLTAPAGTFVPMI